jgi:hypothetical protein
MGLQQGAAGAHALAGAGAGAGASRGASFVSLPTSFLLRTDIRGVRVFGHLLEPTRLPQTVKQVD